MGIKKKKTIFYIGGFELPDKNAAALRVLANGKVLRELGYKPVFVGIKKTLPQNIHIKHTKCSVNNFDSWAVPYPNSKKLWLKYLISNKHLEYLIDHYYRDDLYGVICYNYPFIAQCNVKKFCHRRNAIYIADATEWSGSSGGGAFFNVVKWLDTSLRMRFIHPQTNGIITTSQFLSNFYKVRNCITVELPTLYDIDNLNSQPPLFNKKDDTIKLLYAGSAFNPIRINKNRTNIKDRLDKVIFLLAKVYPKKANFVLNIYGLPLENYLSVFPEHIKIINGLSNKIFFHGRKPHQDIIKNIQKSDFTIFLREIDRVIEAGFPSKFSESISCGIPVITNKISNIQDYIVEGKNCYIIDLDDHENQIEKMLKILCLNKNEILKMKQYCMQNRMFDYKEYVGPVKNFLDSIEGKL